jgi:hypothetical protein
MQKSISEEESIMAKAPKHLWSRSVTGKVGDDPCLVIPTYRITEAAGTVQRYAQNFERYGQDIPIIVFDDAKGSPSRKKGLDALASVNYDGPLFYVGESEKSNFLTELQRRTNLDMGLLKGMFKPSYGGNRNFTQVYTLGSRFMTVDDDMYPFGLREGEKGFNGTSEGVQVGKGRYLPKDATDMFRQDTHYNLASAFFDVIGKRVEEVPFLKGEMIVDSMTDVLTNNTKGNLTRNTLTLVNGEVSPNAIVKVAQSFRTGSSDVDAADYVREFFRNPVLVSVNDLSKVYVISDYTPCVTSQNWRGDCGVSAYDNRKGLPPFIPTRLRFEDYLFRIWSTKHRGVASAHVDAMQTHKRSPYNRPPLASDYLNEELSAVLKGELRRLTRSVDDISVKFEDDLRVESGLVESMLKRARRLHKTAQEKALEFPDRRSYFLQFGNALHHEYQRFSEPEFTKYVESTLREEFGLLKETLAAWPKIIEEARKIQIFQRRYAKRIKTVNQNI